MKLGLKDTITLLSKGYSKKEIDEMIALDDQKEQDDKKDPKPEDKKDPKPEDKKDPEPEDKKDPEPDYKALYEQAQKDLKEAQKANSKKDISDDLQKKQFEADESLKNLVRSFM